MQTKSISQNIHQPKVPLVVIYKCELSFSSTLKDEICFLKYCENDIFSDLLCCCAFVKIHKANVIIPKYCQIRFSSCTELFNVKESSFRIFQFSFSTSLMSASNIFPKTEKSQQWYWLLLSRNMIILTIKITHL